MQPKIVNASPDYAKVALIEPTRLGYLYLAASVRPGRIPWVLPSGTRRRLLRLMKEQARILEQIDGVSRATVFRAIVHPPTARFSGYLKERAGSLRPANFDVFVLVEARSPELAESLRRSAPFLKMRSALESEASRVFVMTARNAKRIADVDTTRRGLFLFNHFAADDRDVMLQLWEYLADWYEKETGLDNSVALVPRRIKESEYAIVNWARWDESPIRHFWHQLSKKSFWSYVTANLEANQAGSMPVYCRLV
jgi:hypothetical protein